MDNQSVASADFKFAELYNTQGVEPAAQRTFDSLVKEIKKSGGGSAAVTQAAIDAAARASPAGGGGGTPGDEPDDLPDNLFADDDDAAAAMLQERDPVERVGFDVPDPQRRPSPYRTGGGGGPSRPSPQQQAPPSELRGLDAWDAQARQQQQQQGPERSYGGSYFQSNVRPQERPGGYHGRGMGQDRDRFYAAEDDLEEEVRYENSNIEIRRAKRQLLFLLRRKYPDEFKSCGWSMQTPKFELEYELSSREESDNERDHLYMWKTFLKIFLHGIEFVNKKWLGNALHLKGWAKAITRDMSKFDRPMLTLYKQFCGKRARSPVIDMLFIIFGSMVLWHMRGAMDIGPIDIPGVNEQDGDQGHQQQGGSSHMDDFFGGVHHDVRPPPGGGQVPWGRSGPSTGINPLSATAVIGDLMV